MLWGVNITGGEGYVDGDKYFNSPEALAAGHWDYIYPTIPEIDYFAYKGATVIRIPFLARHITNANGPRDIAILRGLIEHARAKGITVLLQSWGAGPEDLSAKTGSGLVIGSSDQANQEFANEWKATAAAFRDEPNVMFGLTNEPSQVTAAQWLTAANMAIKAIRDAGATQTITVPGIHWTSGSRWLDDNNGAVMLGVQDPLNNYEYGIHQYLDADGSGGGPAVPGSGATDLINVTTWARANGKKLFLGEYGFMANASDVKEGSDLQNYVKANADVWTGATYWAAGPVWAADYAYSVEPSGLPDFWTDGSFNPATTVDKPQMAIILTGSIDSPGSVTLTNFATISSTGTSGAALSANGGAITNITGGLITGVRDGIFSSGPRSLALTNSGTIAGTGPSGRGVTANTGPITITNSTGGLITRISDGIYSSFFNNDLTLTNSGMISGTGTAATGINLLNGGGGVITNSGLIAGRTKGIVASPFGSSAATIVNSGTIIGTYSDGINLGIGGTIIDSGTISGGSGTAITLGGTGSNSLVLENGYSLSGGVQGSGSAGASNTLELAGSVGSPVSVYYNALGLTNFQDVYFAPSGYDTLRVSNSGGTLPLTISGFTATSDIVDLTAVGTNATIVNNDTVSHMLTISGSGGTVTLKLDASDASSFSMVSDGFAGVNVNPTDALAAAADATTTFNDLPMPTGSDGQNGVSLTADNLPASNFGASWSIPAAQLANVPAMLYPHKG